MAADNSDIVIGIIRRDVAFLFVFFLYPRIVAGDLSAGKAST